MNPITNFDIELLKKDFDFLIEWGYSLNQASVVEGNYFLEYQSNQKKIEISIDINTFSINIIISYGFLYFSNLELPKDISKIIFDKVNLDDYLINQSGNLTTQEKLKKAISLYELIKKLMKEDLRDFLQGGSSIYNINPITHFDIELLKKDFDFLIEWGYILNKESACRGEYSLEYKSKKRLIEIFINIETNYMYVVIHYGLLRLFKCNVLRDIKRITRGKIKLEDYPINFNYKTFEQEGINRYELILKLMKEDLKDFLQGKKYRY